MKAIRWLLKLMLVMITLPLILAVWLAKWFVVFLHMEFCKDMAQHRKRLNEDSFMIEKGEEPRSSSVKMKIGAKK